MPVERNADFQVRFFTFAEIARRYPTRANTGYGIIPHELTDMPYRAVPRTSSLVCVYILELDLFLQVRCLSVADTLRMRREAFANARESRHPVPVGGPTQADNAVDGAAIQPAYVKQGQYLVAMPTGGSYFSIHSCQNVKCPSGCRSDLETPIESSCPECRRTYYCSQKCRLADADFHKVDCVKNGKMPKTFEQLVKWKL